MATIKSQVNINELSSSVCSFYEKPFQSFVECYHDLMDNFYFTRQKLLLISSFNLDSGETTYILNNNNNVEFATTTSIFDKILPDSTTFEDLVKIAIIRIDHFDNNNNNNNSFSLNNNHNNKNKNKNKNKNNNNNIWIDICYWQSLKDLSLRCYIFETAEFLEFSHNPFLMNIHFEHPETIEYMTEKEKECISNGVIYLTYPFDTKECFIFSRNKNKTINEKLM